MIRTKHNGKSIVKQRPGISFFQQDFVRQVYLLAILGARDEDMAKVFNVDLSTIEYWKKKKEDFRNALLQGRLLFDTQVAESLGKRALGYDYVETEITRRPDLKTGEIQVSTRISNKHMPPDVSAIIFWLKNRQRDIWQDSQRIDNYNRVDINVNHKLDTSQLNDEEKLKLKQAIVRQLTNGQSDQHQK